MRLNVNCRAILTSLALSTVMVMSAKAQLFTQLAAPFPAVTNASVAWGDFNNDGHLDLILTGDAGSKIAQIYQGNGAGAFTLSTTAGLRGVYYGAVACADFDNDGDLDLIITGAPSLTEVMSSIYRNDGGGK